jgi:hypothetical protein
MVIGPHLLSCQAISAARVEQLEVPEEQSAACVWKHGMSIEFCIVCGELKASFDSYAGADTLDEPVLTTIVRTLGYICINFIR